MTAEADEQDAASNPLARRMRRAGVALAAVLGFVTGAVGLVFDCRPELRPDPRTTRAAATAVLAVERSVTVDDWLRRLASAQSPYARRRKDYLRDAFKGMPPPTPAKARSALAVRGQLFYVQTRIEGFKRRSLRLRWSIYRAANESRLTDKGMQNATGTDVVGETPSDTSVALVWTPAVVVRGRLFARFEIIDGAGTVLAIGDGPRFVGLLG